MVFVCLFLYPFWKILKKTKLVKVEECDLVWERPVIDAYEAAIEKPLGIWEDLGRVVGIKKKKENLE
jgi:yeast amino acid transporter